ncbi:MAG: hypothetical protein DME25_21390 [Verrucomicrobia bacterium]|nr:MAG: hypothetical protein DME25_21390 [Verrucomicrobiota bacterium]
MNQAQIGIPANGPVLPTPASPYPSSILVSNLSGEITGVSVTLSRFSHTAPDDLDIALRGPDGRAVLLMSDAGGTNVLTGIILTFTDSSTVFLPDSGQIVSGVYRPSNFDNNDFFPGSGPSPPFGSALADFNGTNPNGPWGLYVVDDTAANGGVIGGGWRLDITTTNYPPVITKPPQDQTVRAGGTATFQVEVAGTPPFGYEWLRNNTGVQTH